MRWRWPWSSRQTVTGVRVRWWAGGAAPWCSRRNSSSLCGPSGMSVRARLVLLVAGVRRCGAGEVPVQRRRFGGRRRGGWCGSGRWGRSRSPRASAVRVTVPAGSLFDPVVASAQAEQVVVAGVAVRPGPDVVEVAEHGGDVAAGEPAAPVAGPDPFRHPLRGPVPVGAEPGRGRDHGRHVPVGSCGVAGRCPIASPRLRVRAVGPAAESVGVASADRAVGCRRAGRPGRLSASSSSRAPVTGWQVATCTADAALMVSVSHWWETSTGSPAPGPVTSTRASPPITVPELGPTGSGSSFAASSSASATAWRRPRRRRHRPRRRARGRAGRRSATRWPRCGTAAAGRRWLRASGGGGDGDGDDVSMVALPATRSVNALARAPSMPGQTPSVTYWRARASIAAHALAASSEGKVPSHRSTPGSSTHRRSPHSRAGPGGALVQQVGADPGQHPPAPAPQVRCRPRSRSAPPGRRPRWPPPAAGACSSSSATTAGPVGVQPARGHRRVQPTQPGLACSDPAGPSPASRTAVRTRRWACTAVVASTPDTIAGASNDACPSARWRLHHGAVLEELRLDRRQPGDRRILHRRRHIDHPLRSPHRRRPLLQRPATADVSERPRQLEPARPHTPPQPRPDPWPSPSPPAVSLRRSYRRPLTDPWTARGEPSAASGCTTTRLSAPYVDDAPSPHPLHPCGSTPSPTRTADSPSAGISDERCIRLRHTALRARKPLKPSQRDSSHRAEAGLRLARYRCERGPRQDCLAWNRWSRRVVRLRRNDIRGHEVIDERRRKRVRPRAAAQAAAVGRDEHRGRTHVVRLHPVGQPNDSGAGALSGRRCPSTRRRRAACSPGAAGSTP